MTKEPKISVVMPVYNTEEYLREAVDSILNQTFKDLEFIIINDGATDGTREILESYNDPRIVLVHQEHIGLTKSLNKGIALAKGKYIARQDADDISMPERLEIQFTFLERNKNIALLGTASKIIDEDGIYLRTIEYPSDHLSIQKGMEKRNHFIHGSVMFDKQVFFELGGYREFLSTSQDYDLWLRFLEKFEVANLPTPLYIRRFSMLSVTLKNIVLQTKMSRFARQLAEARKRGTDEALLVKEMQKFLNSSLSLSEKKKVINGYNFWALLFLRKKKKTEAFSLMNESIKYQPYKLFKLFFKIAETVSSLYILKLVIKMWNLISRF